MKPFKHYLREASRMNESSEFDPDDEHEINDEIKNILHKMGGKAWFKGGSCSYLFDVNNPTVAKASDGSVVKCGSWVKCIDGRCDNAAEFFDDFYNGSYAVGDDLAKYFRPIAKTDPIARDGAPTYGSEQERHELATMRGESIDDLKKLSGLL